MSREATNIEITLLKELLDAHVGPIREDLRAIRGDLRISVDAVRTDVGAARSRAEEAHKRIDAYDNRILGMSFAGGGIVSFIIMLLKAMFP